MPDDIVIKAEKVSKKFSRSLKHVMLYGVQDIAKNMIGLRSNSGGLRNGEFWALDDVSFEIKKGETLGIIGANGSGKTTLLKLLNGIFMPDKGRVEIKGRVGALIEVGAGFHPMLTGRENIYVNGAILGMGKKEIDKKFDEIIDFADIGDFLDSPVKHYSSGMYMRLGFAVAVHCEPDVLLIDEVLAVGDANFQNKCFQKLTQFKRAGKTIILVTHDMDDIAKHCDSAILFDNGVVVGTGLPYDVSNRYLDLIEGRQKRGCVSAVAVEENTVTTTIKDENLELEKFLSEVSGADNCAMRRNYNRNEYRQRSVKAEIIDYFVVCGDKHNPTTILSGDVVDIYIKARFHRPVDAPLFGFAIKTVDGIDIYAFNSYFRNVILPPTKESEVIIFRFSVRLNLQAGDYFVDLGVDEKVGHPFTSIERRCAIIHLNVLGKGKFDVFDGMVNLDATFGEVSRKPVTLCVSHSSAAK